MADIGDYYLRMWGIPTGHRENPLIAQVGVAVLQLIGGNPNRLSLYVVNLSANIIYLAPDEQVAADHGLYLAPNGGSIVLKRHEDFEFVTLPFWVVASGAASDLWCAEVFGV